MMFFIFIKLYSIRRKIIFLLILFFSFTAKAQILFNKRIKTFTPPRPRLAKRNEDVLTMCL